MKTIYYFITMILFSTLFLACTADDITEEDINSATVEVFATGEDGDASTDDTKD